MKKIGIMTYHRANNVGASIAKSGITIAAT